MFLIDSICDAASSVAKLTTKIFDWKTSDKQVAKEEERLEEERIKELINDIDDGHIRDISKFLNNQNKGTK